MNDSTNRILLTGASGYIGGRLLQRLEYDGYDVTCLARQPEYLKPRVGPGTRVIKGDALDSASLEGAFDGIDTVYYLIHSMGGSGAFEDQDRTAARNFSAAAKAAGVKRIIYLGGLGDASEDLSSHLKSRQETGALLAADGVPVIEFRASVVIGAGSLSFEMIRTLVQKLPVMTTPQWVYVDTQPIAVSDLLEYLVQALEHETTGLHIVEIGGSDVVSYGDLMKEYARQRGLKRLIIPIPVLTPRLSSLWLGLVTPLFARIGKKLIDSLRNPTVVTRPEAARQFDLEPKSVSDAIREALMEEEKDFKSTRWSDSMAIGDTYPKWGGVRFGTRLVDARKKEVNATVAEAFEPIRCIGGKRGWYYATWLWRLRGAIDVLAGGVGLRRGRPHPTQLRVGDVIDWWRVEQYEPDHLLRLSAEMKLPGRAWLELEVREESGKTMLYQTALFDPVGLAGLLYWYSVYPLHLLIFAGMLRRLAKEGERVAQGQ